MARFDESDPDWQAVKKIDLREVMGAATRGRRWSSDRAERAELWYRRHLFLARKNRGTSLGMLARDADALWHHHIVDTRKYKADCDSLFGGYLDHIPGVNVKARSTALGEYKTWFGRPPAGFIDDCWTPW
jgi:hypothetical protein